VSARPDVYLSADVETDGPIPGPYSMLAVGLCVAGTYDGTRFERRDPSADTWYRELRPISDEFVASALEISGLDRDVLAAEGAEPVDAMRDAAAWVERVSAGGRPVLVAYPLSFDWMFLHWYWVRFTGASPFGHSSCLDVKTLMQQHTGAVLDRTLKSRPPADVAPRLPHTHNALDDAQGQAELFANLFERSLARSGR
jgi:hypothetical protein